MIKVDKPIIVEGKYDKITLENVVDGLIIPTDGFGIFKNKEKCDLIRRLAIEKGIIVMTDSDSAGSVIRGYIKKLAGDCEIINVYVPCLSGKEKRKDKASKEGLLGVEGMTKEIIEKALLKSGVGSTEKKEKSEKITKMHLFEAGLSGSDNSAAKRKKMLEFLGLPKNLSANAMLDILNDIITLEEFFEVEKKCQDTADKN